MTTKESDCKIPSENNLQEHWNKAYTKNTTEKLGWYEESAAETIALIHKSGVSKDASILNVGVGSSVLIDELIAEGYTNLIANDFSKKALNDLKERLGKQGSNVQFIHDDLTNAQTLVKLPKVDVWNDRAVLHFFLKAEEKKAYFDLVRKVVKSNGYVIIAVFALDGAEKCCGLPLQRYNTEMLQESLGDEFSLIDSFKHTFMNPYGGERPYVYTLFQRKN